MQAKITIAGVIYIYMKDNASILRLKQLIHIVYYLLRLSYTTDQLDLCIYIKREFKRRYYLP